MRPVEARFFLKKTKTALRQAQGERCSCASVATNESLEEAIRAEAERLGFSACGFARADAADAAGGDLERWLEASHHGTIGWMADRAHPRVSPLPPGPEGRTAIPLGLRYAPATEPLA